MSEAEVLRVIREHLVYELAEHYLINVESFCRLLLKVLDCGVLAAKVFIVMYLYQREWTCSDLARETGSYRQHVHTKMQMLRKKGVVERVSRYKWRLRLPAKDPK